MDTIVALPSNLVTILEAKAVGHRELVHTEEWLQLSAELTETIKSLEALAVNPALEATVLRARECFERLRSGLDGPGTLQQVTEASFQIYSAFAKYGHLRQAIRNTRLEEVDDFIQGLIAVEQGKMSLEHLDGFRPKMLARVDELVSLFQDFSEDLPADVNQAFLRGIDSVNQALNDLDGTPNFDLRAVAKNLLNGAHILEELDAWNSAYLQESQIDVPVERAAFSRVMRELQGVPEVSQEIAQRWTFSVWPKLVNFWCEHRDRMLLPCSTQESLRAQVDSCLEDLENIQGLEAPMVSSALEELAHLFSTIRENSFTIVDFPGSEWIYDLAVATLQGGVPSYQLNWAIDELQSTGRGSLFAEDLSAYSVSGDPLDLLRALEKVSADLKSGNAGATSFH